MGSIRFINFATPGTRRGRTHLAFPGTRADAETGQRLMAVNPETVL